MDFEGIDKASQDDSGSVQYNTPLSKNYLAQHEGIKIGVNKETH